MKAKKKVDTPMCRMFIRISRDTHRAFRSRCVLLGITQTEKIIELLRGWIESGYTESKKMKKRNPDVPTSDLFVRMPRAIHRAFRARCILCGITQTEKIVALMKEWTVSGQTEK